MDQEPERNISSQPDINIRLNSQEVDMRDVIKARTRTRPPEKNLGYRKGRNVKNMGSKYGTLNDHLSKPEFQ